MNTFERLPWDFLQEVVYLGIDQSLRSSGLAFETADGRMTSCVLSPPAAMREAERLAWLRQRFNQVLRLPKLRMVAMEGYAFGAMNKREALGELGGMVKLAIYDAGCPSVVASPNGVKKFLTGVGSGKKQNVTKEVFKVYGIDVDDDNEADAIVLSQIARMADTRICATGFRREVLNTLTVLTNPTARSVPPMPRIRRRVAS